MSPRITPFLLGRDLRKKVGRRLNRRPAFTVSAKNRKLIRQLYAFMEESFPGCLKELRILPISSIDCTSELRVIGELGVIIFDVEQSNFFDFICVREFGLEMPVFHYNEYAVRISELLHGLGDVYPALRMAQINRGRLAEYSTFHNSFPYIQRPRDLSALESMLSFLGAIAPSFVLGHEIGHFFYKKEKKFEGVFSRVEDLWKESEFIRIDDSSWTRFIQPSILQRFNEKGLPSGNAVLATQMMRTMHRLKQKIIEESQADFMGLIAASATAIKQNIQPERLYDILQTVMVAMERHFLLRRLTERLPRRAERSSLELEAPILFSRLFMLNKIIVEIINSNVASPAGIESYWQNASKKFVDQLSSDDEEYKKLEAMCHRSNIVARGAVYLGAGGKYPTNMASPEEMEEKYGPLAGGMEALHVPFRLPEIIYDLPSHHDWDFTHGSDPGLIGFACAVRDLTRVLFHPDSIDQEYGTDYIERSVSPDVDIVNLVRSPREFVFYQTLKPNHT